MGSSARATLGRLLVAVGGWALLSVVFFVLVSSIPPPEPGELAPGASPRPPPRLAEVRCLWLGHDDELCADWPGRGLLALDLGRSRVHGVPLEELLGPYLVNTLTLMLPALSLAALAALGLGAWSARRRLGAQALLAVGTALPAHWLGMILILAFSRGLGWLPSGGIDDPLSPSLGARVAHAALPVAAIAVHYACRWARVVEGIVASALGSERVAAARARGLGERAVFLRHVILPGLPPLVAAVSESLPALFGGALVTERVFSVPGVGLLLHDSVLLGDHPTAIVILLVYSALTIAALFASDRLVARWRTA